MNEAEYKQIAARHPKLGELTDRGNFRLKIAGIVRDMEAMGYKPRVFESLRTLEQQKKYVARGVSKTLNSYHLAGRDGKSRAVDIVQHDGDPWSTNNPGDHAFWLTLHRLALIKGLEPGGTWIGKPESSARKRYRAFLLGTTPWKPELWKGPVGWDQPHIQTIGVPK